MVNLLVNGKPVSREDGTLFGDFMNSLNRDLATRAHVISVVRVNGEALDEGRESNLAMRPLSQVGSIEITTVDQIELAFEGLTSAQAYARKLSNYCRLNGQNYKTGNVKEADKNFLDLVDGLENLTQLVMTSQSVLRGKYRDIHTNDSSLRIAQVRLVSAIEELLPAKKQNDHVMLADILCNELPEALQEMADYGIPVLQRLRTS
ncbi:MAG: hypothetical protein EOP11_03790 [Proteobacteria bacterium]|jgi:hypothetical protein|nr:MAG: hypothetical protein EOP11_03790 [Pseudomonadota bacterium]